MEESNYCVNEVNFYRENVNCILSLLFITLVVIDFHETWKTLVIEKIHDV